MAKWDPSLHPHGVHGQWATAGGTKGGRKKVDRSVETGRGVLGRGPAAFTPTRRGESAARKEVADQVTAAHTVHGAYSMRDLNGGRSTYKQAQITEYQAPYKRAKAIRQTGSPAKPIRESLRQRVGGTRYEQRAARGRGEQRIGLKRTFGGKAVIVRGSPARTREAHDVADLNGVKLVGRGRGLKKKSARSLMANPTETGYVGRRRAPG